MAPAREFHAPRPSKGHVPAATVRQAASRYPPRGATLAADRFLRSDFRNKMATNRFAEFNAPKEGLPIMVRYFFDVRDGDAFVRDDEGEELLDIADAQIEAAGTLTDMAKGLSMRAPNRSGHQISVEVRDGDGALFQARFTFSRSTQ